MNTQKVLVGGLGAGVVLFVLDFVTNTLLLGERWRAGMAELNPALASNMESTGTLVGLAVIDLVFGILLVWLYAAIRPRFGPGPKTATFAAICFWLLTGMVWTSVAVMGIISWGMYGLAAVTWFVISVVSANVGGRIYKESDTAG